ncbi:hypothetical protein REPUB_Repub14bG0051600 [Reevesia pubescens]
MAKVCCSIEMEPRTLNQGQLNHAREMAADVAQKMEPREASAIFIEQGMGLISGVAIKEVVDELKLTNEEKEVGVEKHDEYFNQKEKAQSIEERPCQCSCENNNIESPDPNNLKEPVTAPF